MAERVAGGSFAVGVQKWRREEDCRALLLLLFTSGVLGLCQTLTYYFLWTTSTGTEAWLLNADADMNIIWLMGWSVSLGAGRAALVNYQSFHYAFVKGGSFWLRSSRVQEVGCFKIRPWGNGLIKKTKKQKKEQGIWLISIILRLHFCYCKRSTTWNVKWWTLHALTKCSFVDLAMVQ